MNCDGCPENTPSSQSFSATLSVPYTEVVTVTVATDDWGYIKGANTIRTKLRESIGHPNARIAPADITNATCSTDLDGCKMRAAEARLLVRKGIEKRMTHEYEWYFYVDHNPSYDPAKPVPHWASLCNTCEQYPGRPYPGGSFPRHDSSKPNPRYSTAEGSSYGSAAVCVYSDIVDCYW